MTTQRVTLQLPQVIIQRAQQIAALIDAPFEEVIASTLLSGLPELRDVPADLQVELAQMTWLPDVTLWETAQDTLSDEAQETLSCLSGLQGERRLTTDEQRQLDALRHEYGRITLRKSRAFALLSWRSGKPFLDQTA